VKVNSGNVKIPFLNKELKHQYLKAKKAANFIGDKNRKTLIRLSSLCVCVQLLRQLAKITTLTQTAH
jgi:hypothetical protein